jgi:hypothetical protein
MPSLHFSPVAGKGRACVVQGCFLGGFPRFGSTRPAPPQAGRTVVPLPAMDALARLARGERLPAAVQAKMEELFRGDFSAVRIHVAPQVAALGATAFTQGSNLYFAPGRYAPEAPHGLRLLGHELAHVVQQRQGRVPPPPGTGWMVVHDPGLEAEAERFGLAAGAAATRETRRNSPQRSPVVQPMRRFNFFRNFSSVGGKQKKYGYKNIVVKDESKKHRFELDQIIPETSTIIEEKSGKGLERRSYWEKYDHVLKSSRQMTRVLDSIDLGYDKAVQDFEVIKISPEVCVLAYATRDYGVLKLALQRLAGMKNTQYSDITWGVIMGHKTGDEIDMSKVVIAHQGD